jgi:potassium efflux system protein
MAELEYERLEHDDERHALVANQEDAIQKFMAELDPPPPAPERAAIEREIRELLRLRRDYLDALDNEISTYFNRMQAINEAQKQIVELTEELTGFIDQHILWIQSARPLGVRDLKEAGAALAWMFGPSDWRTIITGLWATLKTRWPAVLVSGLAVLALVGFRRRLGSKIRSIGSSLTVPEEATIGQVALVTVFTILRALVWPAVLWFLGGLLHITTPGGSIELGLAVGDALQNSASFLFVLMLAYETCQPHGLGEAHFGWRPRNVRVARRHIAWLALVILTLGTAVGISTHQSNNTYETSLGRLAFIVAVLGLAYFVHSLLNPKSGVMRDHLTRNSGSWANRLRYVWYPAAVLTPLALVVASALGYHYTALSLCREVLDTTAYLVVVVLVYYLALRWIQLGKRKMALEQARKRSEAYEQRAARGEAAGEARPAVIKGAQFDVSAISTQAMQMLRAAILFMLMIGCFAIWSDSIPAIGFLERVELWPGVEIVSTESTAAGGAAAEPVYEMVNLQDALWAMVLTVLTIVVAKNIPGLLEITVLQHLPLERGSQFAISTIVRYTITIVGIAVAFRVIGVTWAKVQFLAAALTVGLGFGLNEIFGNFIAGLIILFERPIRVGDTVTVGTTTGTVTQIKIRSTTLVDWDRKELVIPNKIFITDTIVNWTLSSQLLRLVFPVTVEHDTDLAHAEELLLKVADDYENVVKDPGPSVMLTHVGDQGIELKLRLFIPHIDHFVKVKHGIYTNIVSTFRDAGVRFFNFSHRDIEVRSMTGAPVKLADTSEAEHTLKESG